MKGYSSREVMALLVEDGWRLQKVVGSHHQFVHAEKKGKVTLPHPYKDIPLGTLRSIFRQAGIDIKRLD